MLLALESAGSRPLVGQPLGELVDVLDQPGERVAQQLF